jgi:AP2-like factor (ANT lineage)
MSPTTNDGHISLGRRLGYAPPAIGAGALPDPLLLPFDDGFTDEDLLAADAALLGEAAADQTLLLLPLCPGASGCGGSCSAEGLVVGAQAAPASSEIITTAVRAVGAGSFSLAPAPAPASWEVATAVAADGGGSPAPAPAPPSPALPLMHNTSSRTSIYRGVTRCVRRSRGRRALLSASKRG